MSEKTAFRPGDTFTYRSVTGLHLVTWTRDDLGRWSADDGRGGFASDEDVLFNMGPDTTLRHGSEGSVTE